MTAVADQPVRAAGRDGGASRAAAARPGPDPGTTPLAVPPGAVHGTAMLRGWSSVPPPRRPALLRGWNRTAVPPPAARGRRGWGWATGRPGRDWAVAGAPPTRRRPITGLLGVGREKVREWRRRYLLAEIVGTLAAVAAAVTAHALTGSVAPAALAGSVAETVGYYAVILRRTIPRLYGETTGAGRLLRTGRGLLTEMSDFVAAELADTFLIRPGLIYLAAGWAGTGSAGAGVPAGLLIGKLLADVGFYAVVIPSYELRKRLMDR
jgi:hypothetical protein